jgi:hypothetical protein
MSILLIEPIGDKTVRLVGKGLNAAIVLKPGEPQEIEAALGAKLLKQCSKNIRISRSQWIQVWTELAKMTEGIEECSRKFQAILKALEFCDLAFVQENWVEFLKGYQAVKALVEGRDQQIHSNR